MVFLSWPIILQGPQWPNKTPHYFEDVQNPRKIREALLIRLKKGKERQKTSLILLKKGNIHDTQRGHFFVVMKFVFGMMGHP